MRRIYHILTALVLLAMMALPFTFTWVPTKAQAVPALTGNFEEDVIAIGKWLQENGLPRPP